MTTTTCVLPDKPSELIRLALSDLRKCEKDSSYEVVMNEWHTPSRYRPICSVCLAGAVIAQSFHRAKTEYTIPANFSEEKKLLALNEFRKGYISEGLALLGLTTPMGIHAVIHMAWYSIYPTKFHTDMESLAAMLEKRGL